MGVYLNPRNDAFLESVRSEIYVDKTEMISYVNGVLGTEQKFICVSRPRRFGKSMTAKMLAAYYCKDYDSKEIFDNLKIATHESYLKHLNQYDVIFLNMQEFLTQVKSPEGLIDYLQEEVIVDLLDVYAEQMWEQEQNLVRALKIIYSKTGRGFVFIIDEWDCLFREFQQDCNAQKNIWIFSGYG